MMGLLDFLGTDESKLGLGLLAAGGPSTVPLSFGQRLQGAMQGLDADKQGQMRLKLLQSQIDENASQAELRKAQLSQKQWAQGMTAGLLGDIGGTSMGGGSNVPPMAGAGLRGVPVERVAALKAAGGPDLLEAWKAVNVPTSMAAGSYAMTPGQAPVYMASPEKGLGIGPQGVYVLPGAVQAQAGLAGAVAEATEQAKARYAPGEAVYAPDGSKVLPSRLQQFGNASPAASGAPAGYATEANMRTTAQGDMGADPKAVAREIRATQNDLMKPGLDEGSKAALRSHLAQLQGTAKAIGIAPTAGNVVELSPAEQAANKAAEVRAVDTAKADVGRETAAKTQGKSATEAIAAVDRARQLLKQGPTASGIGQLVDSGMNFLGQTSKGAEAAAALDVVAGDLTRSIPRMEGPQSDRDVEQYRIQAGRAADRTTPVPQRLAALDEVERLNRKYASLNGGLQNSGGATGSFDAPAEKKAAPKILDALPTANATNKGQRIRDTTTGKILRSDGMQWKAE
jgi:hypothetical protein